MNKIFVKTFPNLISDTVDNVTDKQLLLKIFHTFSQLNSKLLLELLLKIYGGFTSSRERKNKTKMVNCLISNRNLNSRPLHTH